MSEIAAKGRFPVIYGGLFLLAAVVSFVMLVTDKNLQTDFGTVTSGYYLHWYAVLAMGVADVAGAGLLFAFRTRLMVKIGLVGSGLLALANLGVIATYAQVGFSSATSFADYLFGVTYYGGDIRYLYDLLLAVYLGTFATGAVGLFATRHSQTAPRDGGSQQVSTS